MRAPLSNCSDKVLGKRYKSELKHAGDWRHFGTNIWTGQLTIQISRGLVNIVEKYNIYLPEVVHLSANRANVTVGTTSWCGSISVQYIKPSVQIIQLCTLIGHPTTQRQTSPGHVLTVYPWTYRVIFVVPFLQHRVWIRPAPRTLCGFVRFVLGGKHIFGHSLNGSQDLRRYKPCVMYLSFLRCCSVLEGNENMKIWGLPERLSSFWNRSILASQRHRMDPSAPAPSCALLIWLEEECWWAHEGHQGG